MCGGYIVDTSVQEEVTWPCRPCGCLNINCIIYFSSYISLFTSSTKRSRSQARAH